MRAGGRGQQEVGVSECVKAGWPVYVSHPSIQAVRENSAGLCRALVKLPVVDEQAFGETRRIVRCTNEKQKHTETVH
jgi:hypothetical protein